MTKTNLILGQNFRQQMLDVFAVFTVGVGIGLVVNQLRDNPLPLIYESKTLRLEKAVSNLSDSSSASQPVNHVILPPTITVEALQQFLEEKRGLLLDARPEIFHRLGHIPGAVSFPREDFENAYKALQVDLEKDRNQPLVIYCSNASCEDASLAKKALLALRYTNVSVFTGGWSEWQEKELATETTE